MIAWRSAEALSEAVWADWCRLRARRLVPGVTEASRWVAVVTLCLAAVRAAVAMECHSQASMPVQRAGQEGAWSMWAICLPARVRAAVVSWPYRPGEGAS